MGRGSIAIAKSRFASAGVVLAALLVAACTAIPSTTAPQATLQAPAAAPEAQLPPAVLREHQRILASYGGSYADPKLQAMIEQLVERLVAASDRPDLHYKVTLLNSQSVNAFALPTGQLYVTRGLIALANDQSELASVIGHEMGHVIAHHAELREQEIRNAELSDRVFTDLVTDPQAGAMALARSKLELATFSRNQELQADAIGISIAARAGFDPYGAVRFLASLERNANLRSQQQGGAINPAAADFLSSHPATPERIAKAMVVAAQYKAPAADSPAQEEQARDSYFAGIEGIVFGDDPSEGFVRGRRFLHPRLGFTFTAPPGFVLDNTAQAVLGVRHGGGAALRFDVVTVPPEQTLSAYLTSGWIENIDPASVHDLAINGFPAATATAKGDNWDFRLYAIRFGSDVYRFIFATKQPTPETDQLFRQSVGSFRRLTLAEIQQARPLRLKIVTVKAGDTVEKLAARMAIADRQAERFRVLNGLDAGAKLKPGTEVKIAVE